MRGTKDVPHVNVASKGVHGGLEHEEFVVQQVRKHE